jgi:hypothetical protein
MLDRFGGTKEPVLAQLVAKACLILPASGVDLGAVGELADTSVRLGTNHQFFSFFQFAKALADYRRDRFASAAELVQKVLEKSGEFPYRDVQANVVLAMALHQPNQRDAARAAMAKGIEIEKADAHGLDSGDLGDAWHDWIIARALLREAKALIEGKPAHTEK